MEKVYEKLTKDAIAMIGCLIINAIIDIFLGTFFVAHMLSITNDNLGVISKYYIFMYLTNAISMVIMGHILKKANNSRVFRVGIIIKMLVVIALIFLKDDVKDYIIVIAPILGLANTIYWAPSDNLTSYITTDNNRMKYNTVSSILKNIFTIIVPVAIGTSIDVISFNKVAFYILALSIVQFVMSFWINIDAKQEGSFKIKSFIKEIKSNPNKERLLSVYKVASIYGIVFNLIPTIITVLVVRLFDTNFELGIFQTLFAFTAMIAVLILKKKYTKNNINDILLIGAMFSLLSVFILFYNIGRTELIFYHFVSTTFSAIIDTLFSVERHNDKKNGIEEKYNTENQMLINVLIQIGRVVGFVLLYISDFFESDIYFRIVLLLATICIPAMCYLFGKTRNKKRLIKAQA